MLYVRSVHNKCKILIFSVKNLALVYYKSGINLGLGSVWIKLILLKLKTENTVAK